MPLERVVLRNEYGSGRPELYNGAVDRGDPKAVLDGVAVAGLVGILRQLGDLAGFAAELFHGLQEEVMTTTARSRKLALRVQKIESAISPLEKLALAQKSHLHFCYTAGTDWHVRLQNQRNHFIGGELPKFIMDSYEECREPPRLHLLDKFDSNGPGSCLKKYSDPTFFRKATPLSEEAADQAETDKKHRRRKKKRQAQKMREMHNLSISDGVASISANEASFMSGSEGRSQSSELRGSFDYIECVFDPNAPVKAEEVEPGEEPQSARFALQPCETFNSDFSDDGDKADDDECRDNKRSLQYEASSSSARVSWEEKSVIVNFTDYECLPDEVPEALVNDTHEDMLETVATDHCREDQGRFATDVISTEIMTCLTDDIESDGEDFMDALNTIESETEFESDYQAKQEAGGVSNVSEVAQESSHEPAALNSVDGFTSPSKRSSDSPDTASSNGFMHEELPQLAHPSAANRNSDPLLSAVVSQDSKNSLSEKSVNGARDSHESVSGSSERSSVSFWTNGWLLGLQPSKPPDFKTVVGANGKYKEDETQRNSAEKGRNGSSRGEELIGVSKALQNKGSEVSPSELDKTPPMSGLAYRLFSNGFGRKLSSIHDYSSLPVGSPEHDCFESKTAKSFPGRSPEKFFTGGIDVSSPNSSPPLEHMKISFLPMGAAEASSLKLKFHDKEINQEVYADMLPSFQLIPDPSVHPREHGSDSDDDTFCRSPQARSDDCLDYHSESSSGRWESKSNGHELYDDLCIMPSAESSSGYRNRDSAFERVDQANSQFIENELPSFDVIKSSVPHETEILADMKESLATFRFSNVDSPPPPPLPPSQWMVSKRQSNSTGDQRDVPGEDEDLHHAHGLKMTGFAGLEQQNLLSTWQPKILQVPTNQRKVEETTLEDEQKAFGKVKFTRAPLEFDDKDDFLLQIRAQSFNLRGTSLMTYTRSGSMPAAPVTNAKVSAILEKANAIRQVVARDDGEDDDTLSE